MLLCGKTLCLLVFRTLSLVASASRRRSRAGLAKRRQPSLEPASGPVGDAAERHRFPHFAFQQGVALLVYYLYFTVIGVYRGFITRWSGALLFVRSTSFVLCLYGPLCVSSAYVIGSLVRHYMLLLFVFSEDRPTTSR